MVLGELESSRRRLDLGLDLLVRHPAAQAEREGDVLEHREVGVEGVVLEDHRQVAAARSLVVDALAGDEHVAGRDVLQSHDHPQQRGLATSRRADEDHELPVGDVQAHVVDREEPVPVLLDDVLDRVRRYRG